MMPAGRSLPVPGFWCFARRCAREQTRGGAMLTDLLESRPPFPSHQWFATAERMRLEDEKRILSQRNKKQRKYDDQ